MSAVLSSIFTVICALLGMAFYTLFERKFLASVQWRQGPNKVGWVGFPQPLADALKLFFKGQACPRLGHKAAYGGAPLVALGLSLSVWLHFPHPFGVYWLPYAAISFLVLSSLNIYPLLAAGWASGSKYALLGTMRGIAQTLSYEITLALLLISLLVLLQAFNFSSPLHHHWSWNLFLCPFLGVVWFVVLLAETHRTPFDFVEGESELVSGFNVEYGGGGFTLLFMAEYTSILVNSALTVALFATSLCPLGVTPAVGALFSVSLSALFVAVRASLPRMRYDRLMTLTWTACLPFALAIMLVVTGVIGLLVP